MAERWRPLACLLHGVHNAAATDLPRQGAGTGGAHCNYGNGVSRSVLDDQRDDLTRVIDGDHPQRRQRLHRLPNIHRVTRYPTRAAPRRRGAGRGFGGPPIHLRQRIGQLIPRPGAVLLVGQQ